MAELVKKEETCHPLVAPDGWELPELTEEEQAAIAGYFRSHKAGISGFTPKICRGPSCDVHATCPLVRQGTDLPVGRQCFVELNLIRTWMLDMAHELGLEQDQVFDRYAIGAVALNEIVKKRAMETLAREDLIVDSFRGFTPDGDVVTERKAHPAVNILKEISKLNQQILNDMIATRKEKSKHNARKTMSPSEAMKQLADKMAEAKRGIEQGNERLKEHQDALDAEFTVVEVSNGDVQGDDGQGRQREQGKEEGPGQEEGRAQGQEEPVRREASPSVREERQEEGEHETQKVIRRDPRTGLLMPDDS